MSTPTGVPSASRTTVPDGGSAAVAVMPASRRAAELATPTWPPRWTKTGCSPLAASSSRAVGSRPSRRWVSCQQRDEMIHSPAGVRAAASRSACTTSSIDRACSSDT